MHPNLPENLLKLGVELTPELGRRAKNQPYQVLRSGLRATAVNHFVGDFSEPEAGERMSGNSMGTWPLRKIICIREISGISVKKNKLINHSRWIVLECPSEGTFI